MTLESDWRLRGQHKYLFGIILIHRDYRRFPKNEKWDHDHCEFCSAKFTIEESSNALQKGYCTEDEYHWVCEQCFKDFKGHFGWTVKEN
jgi:hypothetical protein